jgi:hypothetical protein
MVRSRRLIADENGNHTIIEDIINNGQIVQRSVTMVVDSPVLNQPDATQIE